MKFMKKGEKIKLADKVDKRYSSAGPHKGFMCRHYHGAYFVYLFVLLVTGAALLNSNSVSAAPGTLSISIPDQVSLDILPSASGTFASTSSDIAVRTTYGYGYTLGIAAKTANSNALINTNDSSKTIPSITSSVSESDLSSSTSYNNRWGYSPSKYNSAANTNYLVAPTSTTMAILDKTNVANSTNNTYTIKLGARIDATLATGTYENTFVFIVTANPTPYTISYNQNTTDTVTNMPTPNPQTSETFATTVNISSTVPARDGYLFKGWCTAQVSDGATCSGTTYNPDGGGTSLSWTIDQTAITNTLNLYAMWEVDVIPMQTMKETDCVTSAPTRVEDVRDGEIYLVQRLADGNCWLLDNLRLDPTTTPLSTLIGNTNATSQALIYFKNGGGTTSDRYAINGVSTSWSEDIYSAPLVVVSYKDTTTTSYGVGSGKIGVYYNFCAASAGSHCWGDGTSAGDGIMGYAAYQDICPAGWRMPVGGPSREYQTIYEAYNNNDVAFYNALSLAFSGWVQNGLPNSQGSWGYYWSSYRYNTDTSGYSKTSIYRLSIGEEVNPLSYNIRSRGYSVRCVKDKKEIYNMYMQDVTREDLDELIPNAGDTIALGDKRDNAGYRVGRLADGKVWMLDNLALDPTTVDLATLQGNTNASNQTLTYFKNGGGSSPYPATGVNTNYARSLDEPKVVAYFRTFPAISYGTGSGKVGVYYNYCAATAGSFCYPSENAGGDATEDLCPAGWRMPTGGSSSEYQTLYEAYNSDSTIFKSNLSTPLSGYISPLDSGSDVLVSGLDNVGDFWSSTKANYSSRRVLQVNESGYTSTSVSLSREYGSSLRCVFK